MAYLAAQPSMSMEWVARHFDLPEDRVREYIQALRNRAKEQRSEQPEAVDVEEDGTAPTAD
jgi:hypothetical protein